MKKIVKITVAVPLVVSTLSLVACINDDNYKSNITFSGDYSADGFVSDTYNSNGAQLVLNAANLGTAKFTCPSGYIFLPGLEAPSDGAASARYTCNRQGGCDTYVIEYREIYDPAFQVEAVTKGINSVDALYTNNDAAGPDSYRGGGLYATCLKQDQVNDWILP